MKTYTQHLLILIIVSIGLLFTQCKSIIKRENVHYDAYRDLKADIYSPKQKGKTLKPVLVFVHGGSWSKGSKESYAFFGKHMANKGFVTVVINYRLSEDTTYEGMAMDVARAVKWTKEYIHLYGGDAKKMVLSGHSAGGHLAALVSLDNRYFERLQIKNPVRGIFLNDPFGLDINSYMIKYKDIYAKQYFSIFGTDSAIWKKASPITYINKNMPPCLIFLGGLTFPPVKEYTLSFIDEAKKVQPKIKLVDFPTKDHFTIMLHMHSGRNKGYSELIPFIESVTN
jgi:acetyl esterase/lipase